MSTTTTTDRKVEIFEQQGVSSVSCRCCRYYIVANHLIQYYSYYNRIMYDCYSFSFLNISAVGKLKLNTTYRQHVCCCCCCRLLLFFTSFFEFFRFSFTFFFFFFCLKWVKLEIYIICHSGNSCHFSVVCHKCVASDVRSRVAVCCRQIFISCQHNQMVIKFNR